MSEAEMKFRNKFVCPGLEDYSLGVGERYYGRNAFLDGKTLYQAIKMNQEKNKSVFLKVPLDCNLEYTILGGHVKWNGERYVQEGYVYETIESIQSILDYSYCPKDFWTIYECLSLADAKDELMLKVEGPFTILCSLINPITVLKGFRKYGDLIQKVLCHIADILILYMSEALTRGVRIISYADPTGTMEMLGVKNYANYSKKVTAYLFEKIEPYLKDACVHLCGKCSTDLEKCGFFESSSITVVGKYANAILHVTKNQKAHFIGHGCINCENASVQNLWVLKRNEVAS